MKAPEMAAKISSALDSLEEFTEAEVRLAGDDAIVAVDLLRARVRAERELLTLHGGEHVCADPVMPWLATPYEDPKGLEDGSDETDSDRGSEPCWTLRWLARAHQVIAFPAAKGAGARTGSRTVVSVAGEFLD